MAKSFELSTRCCVVLLWSLKILDAVVRNASTLTAQVGAKRRADETQRLWEEKSVYPADGATGIPAVVVALNPDAGNFRTKGSK
ncbi:hypothetical protein BDV11DRAFT_131076 [Aspergillus similis]